MHGHHHGGFGGHGWGGGHGGWGGWGWFFPALLIGNLIGRLFDQQPYRVNPPYPPPPTPPAPGQQLPAATATVNMITCQNCRHSVAAGQAYCPHCGTRLGAQTCQYCGQAMTPEMRYCGHCGAPRK